MVAIQRGVEMSGVDNPPKTTRPVRPKVMPTATRKVTIIKPCQ